MPSYDENIYYNPEKYDLENVYCHDYSDGSYCFDYRVIWKHTKTGEYYTARDSGCSCPSPFEDLTFEDLQSVSKEEIAEELLKEYTSGYYRGDDITPFKEFLKTI